jgi:hypothetical protein
MAVRRPPTSTLRARPRQSRSRRPLPQRGVYRSRQVHEPLTCGRGGLVGYQGRGDLAWRHWAARPPQHVHGAPEQRPALEPWIGLVAALGRDAGDAEARLKHLQHGFDLHHGRLEPDALAAGGRGQHLFRRQQLVSVIPGREPTGPASGRPDDRLRERARNP